MPFAAMTAGGQVAKRSGSISATSATSFSSWKDFLKPSTPGMLNTVFLVASEPVPAVVGTAMNGMAGGVRQLGPHAFQMIHHRIAGFEQAGNCLGGIQRAAAANANHNINRLSAQGTHGLVHHLRRRLARNGKMQPRNTLHLQPGRHVGPERRVFQRPGTGHEQCMRTISASDGWQFGQRTSAKLDTRQARYGKLSHAHNQLPLPMQAVHGSDKGNRLSANKLRRIPGHGVRCRDGAVTPCGG